MTLTRAEVLAIARRVEAQPAVLDVLVPEEFEALVAFTLAVEGQELERWSRSTRLQPAFSAELAGANREVRPVKLLVDCDSGPTGFPHGVDIETVINLTMIAMRERADRSIFVSRRGFEPDAINWSRGRSDIELVDRQELLKRVRRATDSEAAVSAAVAARLARIGYSEVGRIILPQEDVTVEAAIAESELPDELRGTIAAADGLPIRVVQAIVKDPAHLHELTPRQFEEFIADLLARLGFDGVELTPPSRDGGRDIIARRVLNGIALAFFFECRRKGPGVKVRLNEMRALLGVLAHESQRANKAVLVTTGTFTEGCRELIAKDVRLDGKDYNDVVGWITSAHQPFPPSET